MIACPATSSFSSRLASPQSFSRPLCRCWSALTLYHFVVRQWKPVAFLFGAQVRTTPSRGVVPAAAAPARPLGSHGPERSSEQPSVDDTTARTLVSKEDRRKLKSVGVRISSVGVSLAGSPSNEFGCELRDRYNPDVTLRDRQSSGWIY